MKREREIKPICNEVTFVHKLSLCMQWRLDSLFFRRFCKIDDVPQFQIEQLIDILDVAGQTSCKSNFSDPLHHFSFQLWQSPIYAHRTISVPPAAKRVGGVMFSVLALNAVDRVFDPGSGQIKDYAIGICCFSANHAA